MEALFARGAAVVSDWVCVQVRAPRVEEISSVEASLRLDAVASAGFRMSRSKMMDLIKAGTCGAGSRLCLCRFPKVPLTCPRAAGHE